MKIILRENNKILSLSPCIAQENFNDKFMPMVIGITEEHLLLFNDHTPDIENSDSYEYLPKHRIPLGQVVCLVKEKMVKNKDMSAYLRINLIHRNVNDSFFIYYLHADKKQMKKFLKKAKKCGVKIKKRKVDLSPMY